MMDEQRKDFTYTEQQAINNARPYKGYFIGTMSLREDSRYVTYLFDANKEKIIESSICDISDMKVYVDALIENELVMTGHLMNGAHNDTRN